MTQSYFLREFARDDLEEIWLYTLTEWNAEQADDYIRCILARLDWLSENSAAGKPREDIKPGYYCYPEGRHLIFYLITDGIVDVIGIPHQSMDILGHLEFRGQFT